MPEKASSDRMNYQAFGQTFETPKDDVGYTGHKFDADLNLNYMQARYYDPEIGRFYGNAPVDTLEHIGRENPIHGFGRYTYANNNPYKYVDPDGKFGLLGALIGAAVDAGMQIAGSMGQGASLSDATKNINWGSVGASAALGAVGGVGAKFVQAGVKGTLAVGKGAMGIGSNAVKLSSATERVAVGAQGAKLVAAAGAVQAGRNGGDMTDTVGAKLVDSATSPIPVGTIIQNKDKIIGAIENKLSDNK